MQPKTQQKEPQECLHTRARLSPYLEGTLSAREVWTIEKHLSSCKTCSQARRELEVTIRLLQGSPRFDTTKDFMAQLNSQLDALEPTLVRQAAWRIALQDQLLALRQVSPTIRLSALGVALLAIALLPKLWHSPPVTSSRMESREQRDVRRALTFPLNQSVVNSQEEPLEDPTATNLQANATLNEETSASNLREKF